METHTLKKPENCSVVDEIDFVYENGAAPAFSTQYSGVFRAKKVTEKILFYFDFLFFQ